MMDDSWQLIADDEYWGSIAWRMMDDSIAEIQMLEQLTDVSW